MKKKVDWIWHYVTNGIPCDMCGKIENGFPEFICDAHTHGMKKYGHLEFQVVVNYGPEEIGRLLNEMGRRVQNGERFMDGDVVKGLYLDCDIVLKEIPDSNNEPVLRLIIPDKENHMPEASSPPHSLQALATSNLYLNVKKHGEDNDENN